MFYMPKESLQRESQRNSFPHFSNKDSWALKEMLFDDDTDSKLVWVFLEPLEGCVDHRCGGADLGW